MKTARSWLWLITLVASFALVGCGPADENPGFNPEDEENELDEGKYEAWNSANNPAYVDSTFVYEVDRLPVTGKTKAPPIPGDYWAVAKDSINARWDGDNASPAEKVEQGLGKAGFSKTVTDTWGIYGHGRKECNSSSDCTSLEDGSSCVRPRGVTGNNTGRCIPGWWGICHGWAPYAISEPAPVKPVVRNGVTFYPGDLEGLMTLVYAENLPTKFLSQRCNKEGDKLGTDNNGRVRESECRDMNPGTLFVVAANFLGLRETGFVEDKTWDLEVWNQPVRSYAITNAEGGKLKEITKAEAVSMLGLGLTFTTIFPEADVAKNVQKTGSYDATAEGRIIFKMTGTNDADLYVRKGAAPTASQYDCRPYGSDSNEECEIDVASGDKVYWMIVGYNQSSRVQLAVGTAGSNPNYTYNTNAKRFFHVEMDLSYIAESRPARTSHIDQVDQYTQTDHYSFILETDDNGRVQGGEWVGDSRTSHPDFVWWPNGKPQGILPGGISYNEIKALHDEAANVGGTGPTPTQPETKVLFENTTVKYWSGSKYATVGVPARAKMEVKVTGNGDVDLYVRLGAKPTIYTYTCKSTNADSNESCSVTAPASGGTYYVRLRPRASTSTVSASATITPAS